jgi:hypothetical protein
MQYTGRHGQSNYDLDMPTFYLIEFLWHSIPNEHWGGDVSPVPITVRNQTIIMGTVPAAYAAHGNFQGIAAQLFSISYGILTGFLAQSLARQVEQRRGIGSAASCDQSSR